MNLFDMVRRADRSLAISGEVIIDKRTVFGSAWRGVRLPPGAELRLKDVLRFYPLAAMPDHCGWYAVGDGMLGGAGRLSVSLTEADGKEALAEWSVDTDSNPQMVRLPWAFGAGALPDHVDLVLRNRPRASGRSGNVFVAVHRALTRATLLEAARGVGVEIGPGPNPQVRPSMETSVTYVEQMPPEEWNRLYNKDNKYKVDPSLWKYYRIGDAAEIPAGDGSLDFIFSSHVFEHLANPFGHLRRWHTKLKPGGMVLAVVPDMCGTKDALHRPSELSEWLEEEAADIWEPTLRHYTRHVTVNMPGHDPAAVMAQRRSIHAHYFTNQSMQVLLSHARDKLGYAWFKIEHTPNHKDFHFMLARA
jgi:SAM-dependent methyltransferase